MQGGETRFAREGVFADSAGAERLDRSVAGAEILAAIGGMVNRCGP